MEIVFNQLTHKDKYIHLINKMNIFAPIPSSNCSKIYYNRAVNKKIYYLTLDKIKGKIMDYQLLPNIKTSAVVRELKLAMGYEEEAM